MGKTKMKTIFTELESRGSIVVDRLILTSGLYCLVTSGDYHYNRWDGSAEAAVECGRANGLCTPCKAKAYALWDAYTANHISRKG